MDAQTLLNLRSRTDAKLEYARIHLGLLRERGSNGGANFDRGIEESILFHMLGAKEAFLFELNQYYDCGLQDESVTPGRLRNVLKKRGLCSDELSELYTLETEENSWLFHAKEMRDHSTHQGNIPREFFAGGENDGKVFYHNPNTKVRVDVDIPVLLEEWINNMADMLERLRATAKATNGI